MKNMQHNFINTKRRHIMLNKTFILLNYLFRFYFKNAKCEFTDVEYRLYLNALNDVFAN